MAEVKTILEANKTTYRVRSPSGFYIPQLGRHFTLGASDLTLKSILNKVISKSSTAKFWVITRNRDRTLLVDFAARHEDAVWTKGKRPSQQLFGDQLPNNKCSHRKMTDNFGLIARTLPPVPYLQLHSYPGFMDRFKDLPAMLPLGAQSNMSVCTVTEEGAPMSPFDLVTPQSRSGRRLN